jgi:hypothetical protein
MYNIRQYDTSLLVIFPVSQDSDIEETGEWGDCQVYWSRIREALTSNLSWDTG